MSDEPEVIDHTSVDEDAILDKLDPGDSPGEAEPDQPVVPSGEEHAGEEIAEVLGGPEKVGLEPTKDETPQEQPAGAETGGSLEKARSNLKLRAGFTDETLNGLSEEQITKTWSQLSSREADIDRALQERAELKQKLEATEGTTSEGSSAEPTPTEDLTEQLKPFTDEFGSDASKALQSALQARDSMWEKRVEGLLEKREQSSQLARVVEDQRGRLRDHYAQLKGDPAWKAVTVLANDLAQQGSVASVEDAFTEAAQQIYGDVPAYQPDPAEKAARLNGQGIPPTRREAPPNPASMKTADREDWVLDQLEGGATPEQVKQRLK